MNEERESKIEEKRSERLSSEKFSTKWEELILHVSCFEWCDILKK